MNEIKTTHNWHPNTSISFNANGVFLRVSLNIPPDLAKFLSPNNVTKGKHRHVYALKMHIESDMVCKNNLESVHNMLLNNCMKNIRKAKSKQNSLNIKN